MYGILGILVVGVYIVVIGVDLAYKHAKCWCRSSITVDASFIYHERAVCSKSSAAGSSDGTIHIVGGRPGGSLESVLEDGQNGK